MLNLWSICVIILYLTSSTLAKPASSSPAYPTTPALARAQTNPGCLQDWSYFPKSNKCFKVFGTAAPADPPLTWSKAEDYCVRKGGHLAALKSEEEITLVVRLSQATGYDDGDQSRIFIGNFFNGASSWSHPDGTNFVYARWWSGGYQVDGIYGKYPSGVLVTRRTLAGYMWSNDNGAGNNLVLPFVCQSVPSSEGGK